MLRFQIQIFLHIFDQGIVPCSECLLSKTCTLTAYHREIFVNDKRTFVVYKRTDLCDFLYCLSSSNKDSLSQSCRTLKLKHCISLDNMAPLCNFLLSIELKTCTSHVRNGIVPHVTVLHWLWFQSLVPIFTFRLVVLDKRWSLDGSMLESLKQMCWEVFPSSHALLILFTGSLSPQMLIAYSFPTSAGKNDF